MIWAQKSCRKSDDWSRCASLVYFYSATCETTYASCYLWQDVVRVGAYVPFITHCCNFGMVLIPLKAYYMSLDGLCNLVRIDFLLLFFFIPRRGGAPLMQMNYDAVPALEPAVLITRGFRSVLNKCFFCVSTADYGKI